MAEDRLPAPPRPPDDPNDPYADHGAILALIERKMLEWSKGRESIMRACWGSVLYYLGHQWIRFDRVINRWRPAVLKPRTPTPVTNRFASTMSALISLLARIEPRLQFRPATDEAEDKATAEVADRVIEVIEDEVKLRYHRQNGAVWNGLTGGFWLETGYDADPVHGMRFIQDEQCVICGNVQPPRASKTCQGPGCGAGLLMPAVDQKGQPMGQQYPRGAMYVDVVPLFEMFFDPSMTDWMKVRACCRQRTISLDDAKQRWGEVADKIEPDSLSSAGEYYVDSLATLGPAVEDVQNNRFSTPGARMSNTRVTERWFWQMPDNTYPDGLLAVVLGKTLVVKAGPLPYTALNQDGSRTPFIPYTWFPQKLRPGSLWPKTVATDLMPKQAQRNRMESLCEQIALRMANPVWIMPQGANVTNVTGEPGQIIYYNALGPSPAVPQRIQGQNIPITIIRLIEMADADFEELAATFSVVKGDRPEGVSAGIALQLLKERGESVHAPMFILWETGHAEWARQAIEIFREYATEDRVRQIQGRDGSWEVQKFLGADLKGRVNIVPEAASSFPKSTLTERAEIEQAINLGILHPEEPETNLMLAEKFGVLHMLPAMDQESKNAVRESEAWMAMGQSIQGMNPQLLAIASQTEGGVEAEFKQAGTPAPEVRPAIDDHPTHIREHRKFLRSETGQALHPAVKAMAEQHLMLHMQIQAQQAMAAMGARPPGPTGLLGTPASQPNPMRAGSSPARMDGDGQEMAGHMAEGG